MSSGKQRKPSLDIELLRTLVAFADTGSFVGASLLLFRSQSAISMRMTRLEEQIGQPLFSRQGRDVVLTEAGSQLVGHARRILELHDQAVERFMEAEISGEVRIGIPDDYSIMLLPELFRRFSESYPEITLTVSVNSSPLVLESLGRGELDLAIVATWNPEPGDILLEQERVVWVTSNIYPAHRCNPLSLALFQVESPIYKASMSALQNLRAAETDQPPEFKLTLKTNSWTVLTAAAMSGFAVTTMAERAVAPDLRVLGDKDGFPALGNISIVMRSSPDIRSPATSHVVRELLSGYRASAKRQLDGD